MAASPQEVHIAGYRARQRGLDLGGRPVRLWVADRLEDYVDGAVLLRDADAPEPPYWAHLWPGSVALARLLAGGIACAGRRVLDIGGGLGLVAIVAALRGAATTLIDTAPAALRFARASAALNGCRVQLLQGDIRQAPLRGSFDYGFAADVSYDPDLQVAVADLLAARLAPGGRAWCAESVRTFDESFQRTCLARGLRVAVAAGREHDEGRPLWIRLTEVRRE
jgi:predicted nicotinamide N-methyase